MQGKKIVAVSCHIAPHRFAGQKELNAAKCPGFEASFTPAGIFVKYKYSDSDVREGIVTYSNAIFIETMDVPETAVTAKKK